MKQNNYSELKVAAVRSGLRYWQVAEAANKHLPPELHLSENAVTRLATNRKVPSPEQAKALAAVLGYAVSEIFPYLGNNSSNAWNAEGMNSNRCSKCGKVCGESCTLSELDPEKGGEA